MTKNDQAASESGVGLTPLLGVVCPTCDGNGRIEMLEHCPTCKGCCRVVPAKVIKTLQERLRATLRSWWSFDNHQQHTHSWHERERFIDIELPKMFSDFQ